MFRILNNYSKRKIVFASSLKKLDSTGFLVKPFSTRDNTMNWIRSFVSSKATETKTEGNQKKVEVDKLIRSRYPDIKVIAGDDIYHLDRLTLAMRSDYFEKLLLEDNPNGEPVKVAVDKDTFSALVDVIYGRSWNSILTSENYIPLTKAANLLRMKITKQDFDTVLAEIFDTKKSLKVKVFQLYRFIVESGLCQDVLPAVFIRISENLGDFLNNDEFLSLPLEHVVRIVEHSPQDCSVLELQDDYKTVVRRKIDQRLFTTVSQFCANWIEYDIDNRLCHMKVLVNAARRRFSFPYPVNDESVPVKIPRIEEKIERGTVQRYFHRWFVGHAEIDPAVRSTNKERMSTKEDSSDVEKIARNKLTEYLEKGNFYDIVINVEGKIYKLHRSVLREGSGYFADLCSTEYTAAQGDSSQKYPNKDEEYSIEGINQAAFDAVIAHVYFKNEKLSSSNIVPVLKAAFILKIDRLSKKCVSWVKNKIDELDLEVIKNVLDFIGDKAECKDLFELCLKTYVRRNADAEAEYIERFCSIPYTSLEEWLMASDSYFEDPYKLLDTCAKWIKHDVQNRYKLLPQVALAIKSYGMPDYDDTELEMPTDLDNLPEGAIRDELLKILSSISLIPSSRSPQGEPKGSVDSPVFIETTPKGEIHVLNADYDRIATLCLPFFTSKFNSYWSSEEKLQYNVSATMLDDNLFVCGTSEPIRFFIGYDARSNNFFTLNTDSRVENSILNCRNELYCCCLDGSILQYSKPFNRWMRFSKPDVGRKTARFTSNGKTLFRLYQMPGTRADPSPRYTVDEYDFERNEWVSLSSLPTKCDDYSFYINDIKPPKALKFTITGAGNPTILFWETIVTFDLSSRKWIHIRLPQEQQYKNYLRSSSSLIAETGDKLIQIFGGKLYEYSASNKTWQWKKQISDASPYDPLNQLHIVAVHKPSVSQD